MKRGIIAGILFSIVLVISIGSLFILKNSTNQLTSMILSIETNVMNEDFEKADTEIKEMKDYWEDRKTKLTAIVHLQNIENINDMVAMLQPLAKQQNKNSLLVTISRLKVLVEDLYENEFPYFCNIF